MTWFARNKSLVLVYLLALALLWSNAYLLLVNHPATYTPDEISYLRLAQGHFEVPAPHRYRVVLPLLAGGLARTVGGLTALISPSTIPPYGSSFFLLNALLLALAGLFLYRTARRHGAGAGPALVGMAAILCSGPASYVTGLVLVDSAVVLAVVLLYYALAARQRWLLLAVVALGPVAKESFLLFLPVALLYGRFVPLAQRLVAALAAAALLSGLHLAVDAYAPALAAGSVATAWAPGPTISSNARELLSPRGLFSCAGVFGVFNLVLLAGFWGGRAAIRQWLPRLPPGPALLGLAAVLAHLLLFGPLNQLQLLAAPVVATTLALILDRHPLFASLRQLFKTESASDSGVGKIG